MQLISFYELCTTESPFEVRCEHGTYRYIWTVYSYEVFGVEEYSGTYVCHTRVVFTQVQVLTD